MDISDGLAPDASRLAAASGCGVVLRLDQIPISADALRLAACDRATPLEHWRRVMAKILQLLLTASPKVAEQIVCAEQPIGVPVTIIGECVTQAGLWQIGAECRLKLLDASGYRH